MKKKNQENEKPTELEEGVEARLNMPSLPEKVQNAIDKTRKKLAQNKIELNSLREFLDRIGEDTSIKKLVSETRGDITESLKKTK